MFVRISRDDRGAIGLAELMVASVIAAIVAGAMVTWAVTVTKAASVNDVILSTIDELRLAKGQIIKEARFADELYPPTVGDDSFSLWTDADGSGDALPVGETVTYTIGADGVLMRTSDDPAESPRLIAHGVIAAESAFVVSGQSLDLTLSIDLDVTDNLSSREIQSSVTARG
jgi:hypothetical protein